MKNILDFIKKHIILFIVLIIIIIVTVIAGIVIKNKMDQKDKAIEEQQKVLEIEQSRKEHPYMIKFTVPNFVGSKVNETNQDFEIIQDITYHIKYPVTFYGDIVAQELDITQNDIFLPDIYAQQVTSIEFINNPELPYNQVVEQDIKEGTELVYDNIGEDTTIPIITLKINRSVKDSLSFTMPNLYYEEGLRIEQIFNSLLVEINTTSTFITEEFLTQENLTINNINIEQTNDKIKADKSYTFTPKQGEENKIIKIDDHTISFEKPINIYYNVVSNDVNNSGNNNSSGNSSNNNKNPNTSSNSEYTSHPEDILDDTNYFTKYKLNIVDNSQTLVTTKGEEYTIVEDLSINTPRFKMNNNMLDTQLSPKSNGMGAFFYKISEILDMKVVYEGGDLYIRNGIDLSQINIEFLHQYRFDGLYYGFVFTPKHQINGNILTLEINSNCITDRFYG